MSRSRRKNQPKCPEGHDCIWCGPKVASDRQVARAATSEEFNDMPSDPECPCLECIEHEYNAWLDEQELNAMCEAE